MSFDDPTDASPPVDRPDPLPMPPADPAPPAVPAPPAAAADPVVPTDADPAAPEAPDKPKKKKKKKKKKPTPAPGEGGLATSAGVASAAARDRERLAEAPPPVAPVPTAADRSDAPGPARSSAPLGWIAAVAVLAVLALVAASFAWNQRSHANDLSSQQHQRVVAGQLIGSFAETLLTYNSSKPTTNLARAQSMATAKFKPQVASLLGTGGAAKPTSGVVRTEARVNSVYLSEITDTSAEGMVELAMTLTNGGEPLNALYYGKVTALKVNGAWKVDSFTPVVLSAGSDGTGTGGGTGTGSTTPTTTPGTAAPTTATTVAP